MRIESITEGQFERLLPLIAAYQRFYVNALNHCG